VSSENGLRRELYSCHWDAISHWMAHTVEAETPFAVTPFSDASGGPRQPWCTHPFPLSLKSILQRLCAARS